MKRNIAILTLIAATIYGMAAYTRPHEPAGRALHEALDALPTVELPHIPFSGLLDWDGVNDYEPRPTLRKLEVVPATDTPYSPEELAEIYPTM